MPDYIPVYITDLEYSLQKKILMKLGKTVDQLKDVSIGNILINKHLIQK
jgi:hypothetical protein